MSRANTITYSPPEISFAVESLPNDVDAEATILGQILLQPELGREVTALLPVQAYYIKSHQLIYQAILALVKQGRSPDLMQVLGWLMDHEVLDQAGGQLGLANLVQSTVSVINWKPICDRILEKYHRRKLIELGHSLSTKAKDSFSPLDRVCKEARQAFEQWLQVSSGRDVAERIAYENLVKEVEEIELRIENPGLRQLKLKLLGKKHGLSINDLQNIWIKHLVYKDAGKRLTWDELIQDSMEFQKWALHGFAPLGSLVLLHAPGGTGKTRLFYDWAYCLAKGEAWGKTQDWFGYQTTSNRRKILMIQTDETKPEMVEALRLRGVSSDLDIEYRTHWSTSLMPQFVKDLEEFKPDVVLIDSLSSVSYDSLVSENDVEYARPVLFLRYLASKYQCCIFLIHHSNKLGDVRGSTAIQAAASMVIAMERDPKYPAIDDGHRLLQIRKSRARAPKCYAIEANFETGIWTVLGERVGDRDEPDPNLPLKDVLVGYLSSRRNIRFTAEELSELLSRNKNTVRAVLGALAREGLISKIRPLCGGSTVYFIEGDIPGLTEPRPNINRPSTEPLTNFDQSPEVLPEKDYESFPQDCDRLIAENEKNSSSMKTTNSQAIAPGLEELKPKTQASKGITAIETPVIEGDREVIEGDQEVIEENAIAVYKGKIVVPKTGSWRDKPCRVVGVSGRFLLCHPLDPQTKELQKGKWDVGCYPSQVTVVDECQENCFTVLKKGDRITSAISGNTGVVDRTSPQGQKTWIVWDNCSGLKAQEYSKKDLEIMMISKIA